ncbi:Silenced mating-type M-specific polypeptide Mc [Smittium culicis]|uniref:Silenced mating-type M-specific polypeptide Mc n=1 Tax=Smittium culicis TaxID=133412 RepID=A0A1R1WZ92_9FUNG|nr:Silenced mating-type M-specific polypeptide Mc [Smittium culicis]
MNYREERYYSNIKQKFDANDSIRGNISDSEQKLSHSHSSNSAVSDSIKTDSTSSKGYGSISNNQILNLPSFNNEIENTHGSYYNEMNSMKESQFHNSIGDNGFFLNQIPSAFNGDDHTSLNDLMPRAQSNRYPISIDTNYKSISTINQYNIKTSINSNKPRDASKEKRTPRPPNAFIIYRKETQSNVIKKNPGVSNKEISCIIGRMWREEPQSVKDEYKEKANQEKKNHKKMFPDYKYQPRKNKKVTKDDSENLPNTIDRRILDANSDRRFMYPASSRPFENYDMAPGMILKHTPPHYKGYLNTSRQLQQPEPNNKMINYQNSYMPSQFSNHTSNFNGIGLPTSPYIENYRNQLGISLNDNNNFQQNAFLSPPISNKSLHQYGSNGYTHTVGADNLDFDGFGCATDNDYVSNMLSKNITNVQRMYQPSENSVDFHFAQLQSNGYKYPNSGISKPISQMIGQRQESGNQYTRLPEIGTFGSNSVDTFSQLNSGAYRSNLDSAMPSRSYEQYNDPNDFSQSQDHVLYNQNSVFSIPIMSDLQRK